MPSDSASASQTSTQLSPQQVCFVVDDVTAAVEFSREHFGWGPFYQFKAPVEEASYKDWRGEKLTEVALGMAGQVQVEFLHVYKGRDTTGDYQQLYGTGLQHLGIHCHCRDTALAQLMALGATVNELNEYPGIRFAFVDTPTGDGMFEILQPTAAMTDNSELSASRQRHADSGVAMEVDRATIVTADIEQALKFYAGAFGWQDPRATTATLAIGASQTTFRRFIGSAGKLQLELIEADQTADNPYAAHLRRGSHGLVHAGGEMRGERPADAALTGQWLETGEWFSLYDWPGGERSLQIRHGAR